MGVLGQLHGNSCPLADLGIDVEVPMMLLNDLVDDGQP